VIQAEVLGTVSYSFNRKPTSSSTLLRAMKSSILAYNSAFNLCSISTQTYLHTMAGTFNLFSWMHLFWHLENSAIPSLALCNSLDSLVDLISRVELNHRPHIMLHSKAEHLFIVPTRS